jgi:cohesin loading factor subunit SCC2
LWEPLLILTCPDIVSQPDELAVSDYLLRVFRISIPHMPKTAVKFGQELQLILQPMIVKPSNIGGVVVG